MRGHWYGSNFAVVLQFPAYTPGPIGLAYFAGRIGATGRNDSVTVGVVEVVGIADEGVGDARIIQHACI